MPVRIFILLFLIPFYISGQTPRVPSHMEFAGIKLRLTEDAREEIQKDVDALTKSPKYFNIKVERAKAYFPIIERIFREEGVDDDFKYLVLQESALIPDAVSVSDAVGFWQFKDFTAMEVGLRVDNHIDERMNIVSATRGAARYIKKNNEFFDNWLHTLQAYQMGPGGAMRALGKGDKGAKSMVVDKKTYWYVKKYLAHKVAFEDAVDGPGETKLVEYNEGKNKSLKDISEETGIALEQLEDYNKWLRKGKIPDDKAYTVLLPVTRLDNINIASLETGPKAEESRTVEYKFPVADNFPKIEDYREAKQGEVVEINGLPGIIAQPGDKIATLAKKGDIDISKFLKYNDLEITDPVIEGQVYYFKNKRAKAKAHYYVAMPGESLWSVAQKFGVRLKKLRVKNRIVDEEQVKAGRVLWLRYIRPARIAVEYRNVNPLPSKTEPVLANNTDKAAPEKANVAGTGLEDENPEEPVDETVVNPDLDSKATVSDTVTMTEVAEIEAPEEQKEQTRSVELKEWHEADMDTTAEEQVLQNIRKIHVVEPGETLYSLSKKYEVTVRDLLEWNKLNISDAISIGQKLVILEKPDAPTEEVAKQEENVSEAYVYHTVSPGDTLYNIARSYNVTIEDLMTWNDKKDFSINLGEKIKIRKRQVN